MMEGRGYKSAGNHPQSLIDPGADHDGTAGHGQGDQGDEAQERGPAAGAGGTVDSGTAHGESGGRIIGLPWGEDVVRVVGCQYAGVRTICPTVVGDI